LAETHNFSYTTLFRSKSSAIPVPNAVIIIRTSYFVKILSNRAFSTFKIFPRNGKIAWKCRSRPDLADPPAESPSTIYNSLCSGRSEEHTSELQSLFDL